jgi:photosystem II stability/assembly factor-like uncharacterized protein
LAVIRDFLYAAFTPQSLRRFCLDDPLFRPIYYEFSPEHGLTDMIDRVVVYCETQLLWMPFLSRVRTKYPRQVARYLARLPFLSRDLTDIPCPYRGLEPFESEHAEYYFGREAMLDLLLDKVQTAPLVAVVGASGCGKSSLVRAGLVTALRAGSLPGSEEWAVRLFRPGPDPMQALSACLSLLLNPEATELQLLKETRGLAEALQDGSVLMADVAARLREKHRTSPGASGQTAPHLVFITDQFEELYTECRDEVHRQAFIGALLAAAEEENVTVVLTLRADFYGHVLSDLRLGEMVGSGQVNVLPMSRKEFWAAIEEPALRAGRSFQPGLVDTILDDVVGQPGALPLLEHALLELWKRQQERQLTLEAYREIDGVQGAIARRAEAEYGSLPEKKQAVARRILLRLVQPGEGTEDTRRRASLSDLLPGPDPSDVAKGVVWDLIDARLLTASYDAAHGEIQVDVAHEALIRGWPRLRAWLDESREELQIQRRLTETAREWLRHERDGSYLYRGARLVEVEKRIPSGYLSSLEQEFVGASIAARKEERQSHIRRIILRIAAVGALLVAIATVIWVLGTSGDPWRVVEAFPEDPAIVLAATGSSPPTYYVGTGNMGIGRSTDGREWRIAGRDGGLPCVDNPPPGIPGKDVRGIKLLTSDLLDSRRLYAYVEQGGIYRSGDAGDTWQNAGIELPEGLVNGFTARGDLLLVVVDNGASSSLYASDDGGVNWELAGGNGQAPLNHVFAVYIAPGDDRVYGGDDDIVYVGAETGLYAVLLSARWAWDPEIRLDPVLVIEPAVADNGRLYLATFDLDVEQGGIYLWQPDQKESCRLATIEDQPWGLAPNPDPSASIAVYVLLVTGQVLAVQEDGEIQLLGARVGYAHDLLAAPRPDGKGVWLLLAHSDGLLEYQEPWAGLLRW